MRTHPDSQHVGCILCEHGHLFCHMHIHLLRLNVWTPAPVSEVFVWADEGEDSRDGVVLLALIFSVSSCILAASALSTSASANLALVAFSCSLKGRRWAISTCLSSSAVTSSFLVLSSDAIYGVATPLSSGPDLQPG